VLRAVQRLGPEPYPTGHRTAIFELIGYPRHVQIADKSAD
jgi:hypothetical protein